MEKMRAVENVNRPRAPQRTSPPAAWGGNACALAAKGRARRRGAGEERRGREDAREAREAGALCPTHSESEFDSKHNYMGVKKRRQG